MTTPLVTEENLGAWLLRCNPEVWDLPGALAEGYGSIDSWTVTPGYRSNLMGSGQRVVLWASGNGSRIARGIWGLGYVTGPVEDYVPDDLDPEDYGYWLDKAARDAANIVVPVDIPLLSTPVTDADIKAAGMADLEVQRQAQGKNPSWISQEQLACLQPLLPEWPQAGEPEREVTVSAVRGAGFGNPVQNQIVELAAMAAVRSAYEADGWKVEDVSAVKCGWDLTCTRGVEVVKAEVKGVSGARPSVFLTVNERDAAVDHDGWTLAVVTRAISAPEVFEFTRDEVLAAAKPYVFKADFSGSA